MDFSERYNKNPNKCLANTVSVQSCVNGVSQVALVVKSLPANAGDPGGRSVSPWEDSDPCKASLEGRHPLQCSCLENPRDRGGWRATVHGVTQSRARLEQPSTHAHMCGWARSLLPPLALRNYDALKTGVRINVCL